MSSLPRISVVTCSYNQGAFVGETIESVLAQNYPNLEHIVVDGMSTDETPEILARYPHLRVIREPDQGQADAINKGFRAATGEIFCFLNSDDTFLPGALHRVAQEIDPARGRHIVMGRCRFIDEGGRYVGIEHPSHFESFRRVLEVWKGHLIPQPAVFWTREVWERCGLLDLGVYHLDYDLFCRFARHYRFHKIDQVLATYRWHAASKTTAWSEADRLEETIRLSKRYWGSRRALLYWRLSLSLALYRFNRTGRANRLYQQGRELERHGQVWRGWGSKALAGVLAPEVVFYAGLFPVARRLLAGAARTLLERLAARRNLYPQTQVYMDRSEPWEDGWVGPRLEVERETLGGERMVRIEGTAHTKYMGGALLLTVSVDGEQAGQVRVNESGCFVRELELAQPLSAGRHRVEVLANRWVVKHSFLRNGDYRPLAWQPASPHGIAFHAGSEPAADGGV